ncbi:ribonucleoside-diphosphate reductase subunit alpha [Candidatus Pelagibacter sp.]|nr:ribonucleoside-diphosphate reductase subunit alpha [Candidatus Pelagibacter sp.]
MNKILSQALKKAVSEYSPDNRELSKNKGPDLFSLSNDTELFQNEKGIIIKIDRTRDSKLTDFGKATLKDRYLGHNESFQDLFARVASSYADDNLHAQRIYNYISNLWFMPATPVLSNGGTKRGLPISCFLNEASDSLNGILDLWSENVWLAAKGGGIGSYWGNLRSIGEKIGKVGKTSGIIPFIKVMDSLTMAISQGSLRRGSAACYLPIEHPEIEEFIEMRRPTGGDPNRKALNLHHGVLVSDAFMRAVETDEQWALKSPADGTVQQTISARNLWIRLLTARIETGEPYIIYIDTVNRQIPQHHKLANLTVKTSNLCSEITLPTGIDKNGRDRTAVCCLSSLNLEKYDEWKDDNVMINDVMRFLDNVLTDFIERAPEQFDDAKYSAEKERSVGLGVMGFHSYLQKHSIPLESVMSKVWNKKIFKHIQEHVDQASKDLADERGACPDAADYGFNERFSNKTAIAPTASISIICGGASPGVEPVAANSYTHKTLSGSFNVRNRYLVELLEKHGKNTDDVWSGITTNQGSVSHLDFLTDLEKDVFKTAFELDQKWIIELSGDRTPFISQAQSINLFVPADIHKRELHKIHFDAWKKRFKEPLLL